MRLTAKSHDLSQPHHFNQGINYSPATIAPIGQASAQVPQSMQAFGSIL